MEMIQKKLLSRIGHLEENKRFVQESLEMALSLGDFQAEINVYSDPQNLLKEAENRIRHLISFDVCAIYLVDEDSSDITLSLCEPKDATSFIEDEIKFMTEKGLFAWALREKRGVFIHSKDQSREFFFHVISTYSQIRGMFLGLLPATERSIPDTSTSLISIILNNTANAIESIKTYNLIREQNLILQHKIEERTRELISYEKRLQRAQKMEAIGTLAGGVAHDLNNILSGIVSYPELLLMDLPESSPLRKPIQTIQKSGEKAADIVQDLLALARRGVDTRKVVNLNSIISEYLHSPELERLQENHPEVQIETNLNNNLLNIKASAVHISKCVMNLALNAAEAMPKGGKIRISTHNRYVDKLKKGYENIPEGDYVVLRISDNGTGIASCDIDRIFEPFYSKKEMGRSGTGLGMAVVWGTIKDHSGFIDIDSHKGCGTTFTIYFPSTREDLAKKEPQRMLHDYMGNGETVLVVDDVPEQKKIASDMLSKLGYRVTAVSSGDEAIAYIKENRVDVLILDMIMEPGLDGLETYKKILQLNPKQKAIIASGFSESNSVKEAQQLGAGAYIRKPYLLEEIGLSVKSELEKPGAADCI